MTKIHAACVVFLVLVLNLSGCGGSANMQLASRAPKLTAPAEIFHGADLFAAPIGTQWDMENDLGDITHFSIESAPVSSSCEAGNHLAVHITKTAARTYWGVGDDGAEEHFTLSIDPDGSFRGIADISRNVIGLDRLTINWRPVEGKPTPYLIVPPYFVRGQPQTIATFYHGYLLRHVNTNDCVTTAEDLGLIDWKSSFYESFVSTPIYSGWAMVSEQWENCDDPQFAGGCGAHEKWYFAPHVGLVEIDGGVTIKRIN